MKSSFYYIPFFLLIGLPSFGQQVDLVSYLPQDYVTDGSEDYTLYLQRGLDENEEVNFPAFPVLINKDGLDIHSRQTLNFGIHSALIMKPNKAEKYGALNVVNAEHVLIVNPKLKGDRDKHIGTSGEWGMGINILSSKNVTVIHPMISDFWGDGIYIGEIDYKERKYYKLKHYFNENIKIVGGIIDNNRRNGISVISVKGLRIEGTTIKNTHGTMPMAGIDLEPNNSGQHLNNIIIKNVTTVNNKEVGLKYVASNFFGRSKKEVSIKVDSFTDNGSKISLYLGGILRAREKKLKQISPFEGEIEINHIKLINNETPVRAGSIQKYNPGISIRNLSIIKNGSREAQHELKLRNDLSKKSIRVIK